MGRVDALIAVVGGFTLFLAADVAPAQAAGQPVPPVAGQAAGDRLAGVLPNGLKYFIQRRSTTPGEVDLRLEVRAGAMNEAAGQEGIAHLIEHMAFRGSAKFRDGAMLSTMQSLGARPGADANAGTGPVMTTYMFDLPHADGAAVDTGLSILREIAGELTLSPETLAVERGVVLAEGRDTAGPLADLAQAIRTLEVGDHPFARPAIGRAEVINKVTAPELRRFYDAYYRPERAVVVVVGDVEPARTRRRIEEFFGSWQDRGAPGGDPAAVAWRSNAPQAAVATIPGLPRSGLLELWPQTPEPVTATAGAIQDQALGEVEMKVVDARLAAGRSASGAPYGQAQVERIERPGVTSSILLTSTAVRDPRAAVSATLGALQQLKAEPLSQAELDAAVAARRTELARSADSGATEQDRFVARDLLAAELSGHPYLTPVERLQAFDVAVAKLTPKTMSQLLARDFAPPPARVLYFGPTPPGAGQDAIVSEVLAAGSRPSAPFVAVQRAEWTRPEFGEPGVVASRRDTPDLGVTFIRFKNGVKLTVKPTKFVANQAIVQVRFGHGRLDLPRDRAGPEALASLFLTFGGVHDMTRAQLLQSLEGRLPPVEVLQGEDAFVIEVSHNALLTLAQVPLALDVMAQQFSLPAWRDEGWRTSQAAALLLAKQDEGSALGMLRRNVPLLIHSGDERFAALAGSPDRAASGAARTFLEQIMQRGAPEVVVVGDVDVDEVAAAVGANFGALAPSGSEAAPPAMQDVRFPAAPPEALVLRHHGRPDDAAIDVSWPTTDRFAHLHDYMTGLVLADVLKQRLSDDLRQQQGEVYSPTVIANFSPSIPGYGQIALNARLKPADVPTAYGAIDKITSDLMATPLSASEFERAQRPQAETLARLLRRNDTWADDLAGAQDDPRRLDYLRHLEAELARVTPADLQAAAKLWLARSKTWRLSVLPDSEASGNPGAQTAAGTGSAQRP